MTRNAPRCADAARPDVPPDIRRRLRRKQKRDITFAFASSGPTMDVNDDGLLSGEDAP
jgi:hypothetical protein